jgi:hypothetical protein
MMRALTLLMLAMLFGCSTEWRTGEPVKPSTYEAAAFRSASSVGRLSRLVVMTVQFHLEAEDNERSQPSWLERRDRLGRELQSSITNYLATQKGYEVRAIDAPAPDSDAAVLREAGQRLGVDGVVVVERWIMKPWSTAQGILNVFLLNAPLFRAMSTPNLRISIYETASGRLVWVREMQGMETEADLNVDLAPVLGDLENAVPPQLRR